jgi:hypothetical protein
VKSTHVESAAWLINGQLSEHEVQDTTVAVVLGFGWRVDAETNVKAE